MTHCENCGQADPATDEGYTTCCNELVCDGTPRPRPFAVEFENGSVNALTACCWAAIEARHDRIVGGHADCNGCPVHGRATFTAEDRGIMASLERMNREGYPGQT